MGLVVNSFPETFSTFRKNVSPALSELFSRIPTVFALMCPYSQDVFVRFKNHAPLRTYLFNKMPDLSSEENSSLRVSTIRDSLKKIIHDEELYDSRNPDIVICDVNLENALSVKAFHTDELDEYLGKHLEIIGEHSKEHLETKPYHRHPTNEKLFRSVSCSNRGLSKNVLSFEKARPLQLDIKPNYSFSIRQEFKNVLKSLEDFDDSKAVFRYDELTQLLSKYILKRRDKFFDHRNIRVALIEGDPLEKAFNVKAFHRNQVTKFLNRQLVVSSSADNNDKASEISSVKDESSDAMKTFSETTLSSMSDNSHTDEEKDSCYNKSSRKRNISSESSQDLLREERVAPKRTRRLSSFTVSFLGYESTDEETIYSAQGYETVAVNSENERTRSESFTSNNIDDEEEMVYRVEYEIDDEDDGNDDSDGSEDRRRSINSTDEESDLEDVVLVATVFDMMEDEHEFWADSESDIEVDSDYDATVDMKCCKCGQLTNMLLSYCDSCWQERKDSFPKREKPRKKSRAKKLEPFTNSESSKKVDPLSQTQSDIGEDAEVPSLKRSVSHPGESSSTSYMRCESHDSGVGSQESVFADDDEVVYEKLEDKEDKSVVGFSCKKKKKKAAKKGSLTGEDSVKSEASRCTFCFVRPKNATLIHGKIGHTICCYQCAKKLWKKQSPCPICRRKIEKFVFNVEA